MSEKPILFTGEMVRAILEGRKTQTRRVIKADPGTLKVEDGQIWKLTNGGVWAHWLSAAYSPYGTTGGHIWVRETWATPGNYDHIKPSELAASHFSSSELVYRATEQYGDVYYKWRPSIFMPRWASRITLEITGVRVERVQDITTKDVYAEGAISDEWVDWREDVQSIGLPNGAYIERERDVFTALWDSINAKRGYGWDVNPWCRVIEFQRA